MPKKVESNRKEPPLSVELAWIRSTEVDSRFREAIKIIMEASARERGKEKPPSHTLEPMDSGQEPNKTFRMKTEEIVNENEKSLRPLSGNG